MITPRVFIIRHGETEWSLNGRHTGTTDIPLTANGEKRIRATGYALVGEERLIVPENLRHIYVSPRQRAQRTLELLDVGCKEPYPGTEVVKTSERSTDAAVEVTEDIREWDYGDYEGMLTADIKAKREKEGLGSDWSIWKDGCSGGESPQQVTDRLDKLIKEIRDKYHGPIIGKSKADAGPCDILIVAHGHILRCFAARWIGKKIDSNPHFILEAGGVGTLSYEHHSIDEPALVLGGAFMSDLADKVET